KRVALLTSRIFGYVPDSTEPMVFLHEPTRTFTSGGHQWWFVPADEPAVFVAPRLMTSMMALMGLDIRYMVPGKITLECTGGFAVHDREALRQSCAEILSWEFDALLDVHAQANKSPREGAKALLEEALGPIVRGEWDQVPYPAGVLPNASA
ncbi:MAG: hypothetical protein ACI8PZ_003086, partial [Myxococcota bacterium]